MRTGADTGRSKRSAPGWLLLLVIGCAVAATTALAATGAGPFAGTAGDNAGAGPGLTATERVDRFDSGRAMRIARLQVDAGPRPAGSRTLRRVGEKLRRMLPAGRFENVPGHPGLRNIVGSVPGEKPVLLVASHYDTLRYPRGSLGANNAAAAVGAVIELARLTARRDRPDGARAIRFVLFDGEQSPSPDDSRFYELGLRGSKAYARAHADEVDEMVLLDYIGNRRLRLPREGTSDPDLWEQVRAAGARVGAARVFPDEVGVSILDDTTPFQQTGIPTVNLIDWDDPHRHRLTDTYDKLSERSVDAVGETIAQFLIDRDTRR